MATLAEEREAPILQAAADRPGLDTMEATVRGRKGHGNCPIGASRIEANIEKVDVNCRKSFISSCLRCFFRTFERGLAATLADLNVAKLPQLGRTKI